MLGNKAHTRFGGNIFDPSPSPTVHPADPILGNDLITPELLKVLQDNGLEPDPSAVYILYASNFPALPSYDRDCAFHGYTFEILRSPRLPESVCHTVKVALYFCGPSPPFDSYPKLCRVGPPGVSFRTS